MFNGGAISYRTVAQWADNTMAFYLHTFQQQAPSHSVMQRCSYVSYRYPSRVTFATVCRSKHVASILCEFDSAAKDTSVNILLHHPANQSLPFVHVICRPGHMTHAFLACDQLSACWGGDTLSDLWTVESVASCSAPLVSLPPHFSCSSRGSDIPYSLVCDHKPDCLDSSDEDFCQFQDCVSETSHKCGSSMQVTVDCFIPACAHMFACRLFDCFVNLCEACLICFFSLLICKKKASDNLSLTAYY